MSLLALSSTTAIVVGLCAALPQLAAMVRARSAAGQSAVGWALGAFVNALMVYVNLAGYHALSLAAGNALSVLLCLTAVGLVWRFGTAPAEDEPAPGATVAELPTTEFWALRDHLEHEAARRTGRQLVAA